MALTIKWKHSLNPSDGKLEWVDDKGEPLPDDTTVKANTTYKWRFTPDDDNYTTLTGEEVELYHKSSSGSYYEDAVDWAVENGITQGTDDTHFAPGRHLHPCAGRGLPRRAASPKPETRTMPFTDVPAGSYYYDAVLWAVENGIAKGTSDTTFSPNMTCTRAQIVAFLWRSEKSPGSGYGQSLCRCEVHRLLC